MVKKKLHSKKADQSKKHSHHTKNFLTKKVISTNSLDDIPDLAGKIQFMMKRVKALITERQEELSSAPTSSHGHHHHHIDPEMELTPLLSKLISAKITLSKLRSDMLAVAAKEASIKRSEGFDLEDFGGSLAKIGYVGLPSVGKKLAPAVGGGRENAVEGRIGAYAFTTMTAVPGVVKYRGAALEMIDLPGLIEGAALQRQRHIFTAVRRLDMMCMLLNAAEDSSTQVKVLVRELDNAHIRINSSPDSVKITRKATGSIQMTTQIPLTHINPEILRCICKQFRIHHAEFLFYKDATIDDIIDIIEGNRKYMSCLFVYTMIDLVGLPYINNLVRVDPSNHWAISVHKNMGIIRLLDLFWVKVGFFRTYYKKRGERPDFEHPIFLKKGCTIKDFIATVERESIQSFRFCYVWGASVKQFPSQVGLKHHLAEDDVIQIVTK